MAVDDVYLLTVNASQFSSLRQTTLAWRCDSETEPVAADFLSLANALKETCRTNQHTSVTYTTWRARQIRGSGVTWPETGEVCTPTGGKYFEGQLTGSLSGTNGGTDALPPQCALVVTLRSDTIGRSHRGRVYQYGFPEGMQTAGTWGSSDFGEIVSKWAAFITLYTAATTPDDIRLGIWSTVIASGCKRNAQGEHVRYSDARPELAFTPVTSHLVRSTVQTQRRRVSGVGL